MGKYIVAKFGTDWSIFADARINKVKYCKFSNSRADNSDNSGLISSIIIRDLMVIYILTKFAADWLIFVDARVLTRKLWTDGRTYRTDLLGLICSCSNVNFLTPQTT